MIHKFALKLIKAELRRRFEKRNGLLDAEYEGTWEDYPDQRIGSDHDPYNDRWFLIPKNPWFGVYVHHFQRSDDDRALHDHPWAFNISWLLDGDYDEITFWRCKAPYVMPTSNRYAFRDDEHFRGVGWACWWNPPRWKTNRRPALANPIPRKEGQIVFRWGASPHRVMLKPRFMRGSYKRRIKAGERSIWTLFIVGPKVREWGFYCETFWRHWKDFTSADGMRGRGCEGDPADDKFTRRIPRRS